MPKRIISDHDDFLDAIRGRKNKRLQKFIKNGSIVRRRGKNGKMTITVPHIESPRIVFGDPDEGVGRGPGEPGDVIKKAPQKGKGDKGTAGNDPGEGININVDLEEVLQMMQAEWKLPDLKPKPNQVLQEERIKYTDISLLGPESLRHNRRTFQQALKRTCASGQARQMIQRPGFTVPCPSISVIESDKRYRQYKIINEPSSNAAIFFARDWSASMDATRCDVVSDMSWWMEQFISRCYKRVERIYVGHDTVAEECDQKKFYNYRYGGGTNCSSAFKYIAQQFENRFPPNQWNIYVLYFTDGENWGQDNEVLLDLLQKDFGPEVANLVGITQVLTWRYEDSVKAHVDSALEAGKLNSGMVRTTAIGVDKGSSPNMGRTLTEEERNSEIMRAIGDLLGAKNKAKVA